MTENDKGLEALREPFPKEVIGKLPKLTCKSCTDSQGKVCSQHSKSKCQACGNYISSAHIDLDYVGHAEVTDRLLSVDPAWSWEPLAFDEFGVPRVTQGADNRLNLWIRLTVCGVSRIGVGSVLAKSADAEKQLIGDALRNAAMRFGVALELWAKDGLESQVGDAVEADSETAPRTSQAPPLDPESRPTTSEGTSILDAINGIKDSHEKAKTMREFRTNFGAPNEVSDADSDAAWKWLIDRGVAFVALPDETERDAYTPPEPGEGFQAAKQMRDTLPAGAK